MGLEPVHAAGPAPGVDPTPVVEDLAAETLQTAQGAEGSFVRRILHRLEFEQFIWLTSQPFLDGGKLTTKGPERLKSSFEWIAKLIQNPERRRMVHKDTEGAAFQACSVPPSAVRSDVMGHHHSVVPYNHSKDEFENYLKAFEYVEKLYEDSCRAIAERQIAQKTLEANINEASAKLDGSRRTIDKKKALVPKLDEESRRADAAVKEAEQHLQDVVSGELKKEIQDYVNC